MDTWDAPVSNLPIIFPVPSNTVPEVFVRVRQPSFFRFSKVAKEK